MKTYLDIYRRLGLSSTIAACAAGEIPSPVANWRAPAGWYVFPPALVPIWSDDSGPNYIGAWKHWFVSRRLTFVEQFVESSRVVIEFARTEQQLFTRLAACAISSHDGIDAAVLAFANSVGLTDLGKLDEALVALGDSPEGLRQIQSIATDTPKSLVSTLSAYNGDFAVNQAETCGFETEQEAPRAHEWARQDSGTQPRLFESLLARGQLGPAWMALNSPGWDLQEARDALGQLDLRAKDDDLGALVRAWLAVSANESGRY